jgi:hypothetical protein
VVPVPVPANTVPLWVRVRCPPQCLAGYPRDSRVYSKPTVSTVGFRVCSLQYRYILYIIIIQLAMVGARVG